MPERSPSLDSDCCGGVVDGVDLVEEELDELEDYDDERVDYRTPPDPASDRWSSSSQTAPHRHDRFRDVLER